MDRDHIRVLINEAAAIVDLVVDNQVEILLGAVLGDLLQSEFLGGRHDEVRYLNRIGGLVSGQVSVKNRGE